MPLGRARRIAAVLAAVSGIVILTAGASDGSYPDDPWPAPTSGTVVHDQSEALRTFGGYWSGDWGDIVFRVSGDDVVGVYPFDQGIVVGRIVDGVLNGWWCEAPSRQPPTDAGPVQMRIVVDAAGVPALDGRWRYAEADGTAAWAEDWDVGNRQAADTDPDLEARLDGAAALCDSPYPGPGSGAALGADDPSTLSTLPTLTELNLTPARTAATAGAAAVFIAVAFFPGVLLDSTLSANYDRLFGWTTPIRRRLSAVGAAARRRIPNWLGVTLGVIAVTVISAFIEPRFGVNLGSLRILLSIAIAIVLERLLFFTLAARAIRTRQAELGPAVVFRPGSLVLVVIAVLLSRLTGFHPGIIFGVVLGLSFAVPLTLAREARLALAGAGYALGLGILGWLGYSLLVGLLRTSPGLPGVLATETLSSLAIAGLTALPIALLPLKDLEGGIIWRWNRWVWAGAYLVALTAFLLIVLPLPASWDQVPGTFLVWTILFLVYCAIAVLVWALFRRRRSGSADEATPDPQTPPPADVSAAP